MVKIRDRIRELRVDPPEWRSVVGYEGVYEVSDAGDIRRIGKGRGVAQDGRLRRLASHQCGYFAVTLYRGGRVSGFLVHRLVAEAFIGRVADMEINHIDGDKRNNHVANLEIATRQANIDHAVATGLIASKGECNSQSVLSADRVREIRGRYVQGGRRCGGMGYKALAVAYGVSWGTIRDIIKRKIWQHI